MLKMIAQFGQQSYIPHQIKKDLVMELFATKKFPVVLKF